MNNQTFMADNGLTSTTTGCTMNPWTDNWTIPYNPSATFHFYSPMLADPTYPYKIRKVENGLILNANGKEFVFKTSKELSEFLAKEIK